MLNLTDAAVKKFKDLIGVRRTKDHGVRIFASSGG
jgi:Fe-S cluster assembly iron-binding protein IscA